jgi:hypothetical protein
MSQSMFRYVAGRMTPSDTYALKLTKTAIDTACSSSRVD